MMIHQWMEWGTPMFKATFPHRKGGCTGADSHSGHRSAEWMIKQVKITQLDEYNQFEGLFHI